MCLNFSMTRPTDPSATKKTRCLYQTTALCRTRHIYVAQSKEFKNVHLQFCELIVAREKKYPASEICNTLYPELSRMQCLWQ